VLQAQQEGKQVPYGNHNPDYQVDLDAIPLGAKIAATAVLTMLAAWWINRAGGMWSIRAIIPRWALMSGWGQTEKISV